MSYPITIEGQNDGVEAIVSRYGQLVTAPIDYSTAYPVKFEVAATGYNFVGPIQNFCFVITDIILTANKNVGASDATVDIYESDGSDSTTIDKSIVSLEMQKNSNLVLSGLNFITGLGIWINGKTDDDDIFATLAGYYVRSLNG